MKQKFSPSLMPREAVLLTCSSHEDRCQGLLSRLGGWKPIGAAIFHYDDSNPKREQNHEIMEAELRVLGIEPTAIQFAERSAVQSLRSNMDKLKHFISSFPRAPVVMDISVLTKRHLLMMLRWLDDADYWERLCIVYNEPDDYDVSKHIPLSFGLLSLQHIPGFSACSDLSRPLHLVLFLGYEGDRALAVHEHVQPMQTTIVVPDPPYRPSWTGRTESFNADLIALVGETRIKKADSIDPAGAQQVLKEVFEDSIERGKHAKAVSPLGTKPQVVGIYEYLRTADDPPSILYASPLRHNHGFSSHGTGETWILKQTG